MLLQMLLMATFQHAGPVFIPATVTEVRVEFNRAPQVVFPQDPGQARNYVRFRFSPRIEVGLSLQVKKDGERMEGEPLELMVVDQQHDEMTPYERLIGDAVRGDQTLFARQDAVEECWRIVQPILDNAVPVHVYEPGTWGPAGATSLEPEGGWIEPRVQA